MLPDYEAALENVDLFREIVGPPRFEHGHAEGTLELGNFEGVWDRLDRQGRLLSGAVPRLLPSLLRLLLVTAPVFRLEIFGRGLDLLLQRRRELVELLVEHLKLVLKRISRTTFELQDLLLQLDDLVEESNVLSFEDQRRAPKDLDPVLVGDPHAPR